MPRGQFDRSARRERTRAALLEAAARVYARNGFAGATLDEVAAEAGYTKGAVYAHFGSKENLLIALLEEHFARDVAEQLALFDRERATWERPFAGSDRWMEHLLEEPDRFRLFVELWAHAQRDERLRARLADGLDSFREVFAGFAEQSASDSGRVPPAGAVEQSANVMLALGLGLSMLRLVDAERVPAELLGTAVSIFVRAVDASEEAREELAALTGVERSLRESAA
jgi:AcrR family transcriptional regulator